MVSMSGGTGSAGGEKRQIFQSELDLIIDNHKEWLARGRQGEGRADFSNTDISQVEIPKNIDLSYAVFANCSLIKCVFSSVKLEHADFTRCNAYEARFWQGGATHGSLRFAVFDHANLRLSQFHHLDCKGASFDSAVAIRSRLENCLLEDAHFYDATLRDAVMHSSNGLSAEAFAGADLTGSQLPPHLRKFSGLEQAKNISTQAKRVFTPLLAACAYAWLTILQTKPWQIIVNSSKVPLPIVNTPVPISDFYIVVPAVLLSIYIYLHVYLQRLWDCLSELPAFFSDGRSLDKVAYPWLFSGIVLANVPRLHEQRPSLSLVQRLIAYFLGWSLIPITLLYVSWEYFASAGLKWVPVLWLVLLATLSVALGVLFFGLSRSTLQRVGTRLLRGTMQRGFWSRMSDRLSPSLNALFAGISTLLCITFFLLNSAVDRESAADFRNAVIAGSDLSNLRLTNADFTKVSGRGAVLSSTDMSFVRASAADFSDVDATDANFIYSICFGTSFAGAVLYRANFASADLRSADFRGSICLETNFKHAWLQECDLRGAWLGTGQRTLRTSVTRKMESKVPMAIDVHSSGDAKGLSCYQIVDAITDSTTILPYYLVDSLTIDSHSGEWTWKR